MSLEDIAKYQVFVSSTLQPRLQDLMSDREKLMVEKQDYIVAGRKLNGIVGENALGSNSAEEKLHSLVDIGCGVHAQAVSKSPVEVLKVYIKHEDGVFRELPVRNAIEFATSRVKKIDVLLEDSERHISNVVGDIEMCLSSIAHLKSIQEQFIDN